MTLCTIPHKSKVTQGSSVDQLFNLVELPAILDSLFHKIVNTTSTPIVVEGGVWWVATKWYRVPIQKFCMAIWCQFRLFSSPNITKHITLFHQPVMWQFSASSYLSRKDGVI